MSAVHPIEIILRTTLAFVTLLFTTRVVGREIVTPLSHIDLAARIALGSMAAALAYNLKLNPLDTAIAILTFGLLSLATSWAALLARWVRKLLVGAPVTLIQNGKILEENLRKVHYRLDYLVDQLRLRDVFDLSDVEFAILEPNGVVCVPLYSQKRPVTPADLGLPTKYEGLHSVIILEGQVIHSNLKRNNLTEAWLLDRLRQLGTSVEDVVLATLDTQGKLYVDKYQD